MPHGLVRCLLKRRLPIFAKISTAAVNTLVRPSFAYEQCAVLRTNS